MNLTTLKYLVSIAELGTITAAAEAHYVTQPAVSIRLRKLQDELGLPLVELEGRRVRLTRAGEVVLGYARQFGRLEEELVREISDLEGLDRGRIAIGTIDAASAYVLPRVFSEFRRRYPGIEISLEVMATNPLLNELRAGRLDLVVGTLPIEGGGDLEIYPIYTERLLLVAHPTHPLARRRNLTSAALEGQALISFHEGAITRRIVEKVLGSHGVSVRVTMTTDSPEAIRNLVAAGLGLAILPERVVRDGIRRRSIVEIRIPGLAFERTLGLIIPQRRYCSSTVRAFLAVMATGLAIKLPARLVLERERSAAEKARKKVRKRLKKRRIG